MKKSLLKYGLIASLIVVGIPLISGMIMGFGPDSFALSEVIGYTSIIVAMATVYFAIRQYRDQQNEGRLHFGTGMKIGLLISTIGGIAFGIYNAIFVTYVMPDFNEQYFAYSTNTEVGTPEFEKGFTEMMTENEFMFSVLGGSIVMFLTVFLIGLVLTTISALILKHNPDKL